MERDVKLEEGMRNSEKRTFERIALVKDYLQMAIEQIDSIYKDDRTPETDRILNDVADGIFEAQERLKCIDEYQYYSMHIGEQIKPRMVHRKKKG